MERLFVWWNAVYTLPLAVVLIFLTVTALLSLVGGAFDGGGHSDADTDADTELDADVDADVDADTGLHADADGDLDGDGDHDVVDRAIALHHGLDQGHDHTHGPYGSHSHPDPGATALAFLGAGQMPLMMLLQVLVLFWGITGFMLHQAFHAAGPSALAWSVPAALVVSVVGARSFAALFGRMFKPFESAVSRRNQMVGRTGRVVYAVTAEEGTVSLRDADGTLHRFRARCPHSRLEPGQEVVVTGYDPQSGLYQVDASDLFLHRA